MASNAKLRYSGENEDGIAYEVYDCALTPATTAFTITPNKITSIEMVTITPTNAAAATAAKGHTTTWVVGSKTVVVTSATSTTYLVKIEGTIGV